MGYNLPEGNNHYLDDCDMICQECERKDDVDNGEYHNHRWYCKDCYDRLFKECPKCHISIISTDDELCEDCLAEKTYDESAEGMFDKLGYTLTKTDNCLTYTCVNCVIEFILDEHRYVSFYEGQAMAIDLEEHKAITQQMKELGWL